MSDLVVSYLTNHKAPVMIFWAVATAGLMFGIVLVNIVLSLLRRLKKQLTTLISYVSIIIAYYRPPPVYADGDDLTMSLPAYKGKHGSTTRYRNSLILSNVMCLPVLFFSSSQAFYEYSILRPLLIIWGVMLTYFAISLRINISSKDSVLSSFLSSFYTIIFSVLAPLLPITLLLVFPSELRLANFALMIPYVIYAYRIFPRWRLTSFGPLSKRRYKFFKVSITVANFATGLVWLSLAAWRMADLFKWGVVLTLLTSIIYLILISRNSLQRSTRSSGKARLWALPEYIMGADTGTRSG
jgi:hypothetical protein